MKFYRADCWATLQYGKFYGLDLYNIRIYYIEFDLVKETPCGYWIQEDQNCFSRYGKIWVSKDGKNRIAYPTKKQALFNFYKRRERYIEILESRLEKQKQIFKEIQEEMNRR